MTRTEHFLRGKALICYIRRKYAETGVGDVKQVNLIAFKRFTRAAITADSLVTFTARVGLA